MPNTHNRPRHYRKSPRAPKPVHAVAWWRAPCYELVDDGKAVAPVGEMSPVSIHPASIDWVRLITWSDHLRRPAQPSRLHDLLFRAWNENLEAPPRDVAQDMAAWCAEYGCPGTLLYWATDLRLPPDYVGLHNSSSRWVSQRTYRRIGPHWFVENRPVFPARLEHLGNAVQGQAGDPLVGATLAPRFHHVANSSAQQMHPDHDRIEVATALYPDQLQAYFRIPFAKCPHPLSRQFWEAYKEPTLSLLRLSRLLRQVTSWSTRFRTEYARWFSETQQHAGWVNDAAEGVTQWRVCSLVHAYVFQNQGPTISECVNCRLPFLPTHRAPHHRFCSTRCENSYNRRQQRARQKEAAWASGAAKRPRSTRT